MLTVRIGEIVINCYDPAAVQAHVTGWNAATYYAPQLPLPEALDDRFQGVGCGVS